MMGKISLGVLNFIGYGGVREQISQAHYVANKVICFYQGFCYMQRVVFNCFLFRIVLIFFNYVRAINYFQSVLRKK